MRRRRAAAWAEGLLALALLVAGGVLTGLYFWVAGSIQDLEGSARLRGLDSMVTVYADEVGIPHVFAGTERDVFRAQGWIHASERLWQLEFYRRLAEGRLAEAFGPEALETDRLIRTLDLWGAAGRSLDALPQEERTLLDAYVAGVNERLRTWSGPWPPEFLILRLEPEPWTARHSVAIGKIMALDLSGWRDEIARFRARALLPPEKAAYLDLPYPAWGPTILGDARSPAAPGADPPVGATGGPGGHPPADGSPRPAFGTGARWDPVRVLGGVALSASNAWAVAGVRSWGGQPLLANDMHLALRSPSTWYLNALHAERSGLHVAGVSIPGVPGVIVGYNREIAWGFTNGMVDDADFWIEEIDAEGRVRDEEGGWVPLALRRETLRVRGRAPVELRVRSSPRGPLIGDVLPGVGAPLSVQWTGLLPTTELRGILGMNRAEDPAAFDRAVQRFTSPQQNVVYASARGALGYRLSGTVPIREGWDGSTPLPASEAAAGWTRFWPADSLPALRDPPRGYLVTANNLQARELFGVLGTAYPLPFRAQRITERLEGELAWTVDLMRGLQTDTRSLLADRVLRRAVAAADRIDQDSVGSALGAWNRLVSLDSREATLFHAWLYRLRQLIGADEFGGPGPWAYFPHDALLRVLEEGEGPWVDDVGTDTAETLEGLEEKAMRDALSVTAGRRWRDVHRERSAHVLGGHPVLDRIFGFDIGPSPAPGGSHTVRPGDPRIWASLDSTSWTPPWNGQYGPSQRFVAELRPGGSRGLFLLPTGQSGNPLSPHYRNMAPRWNDNDLVPVPLYRSQAFERAERVLQLLRGGPLVR